MFRLQAAASRISHRVFRFFKAPKGTLVLLFVYLLCLSAKIVGPQEALPNVLVAVAAAGAIDALIVRLKEKKWDVPDGAILTGMIVAFVLRTQEPWTVAVAAAAVAIVGKHLLRTRWSNIFNPAAFALVVVAIVFQTGQSWWGALPESGIVGVFVLLLTGIFIVNRINKAPLVLAFLGTYFALFTIAAWFGKPDLVAEVYRSPDLHACLFFAFFMLDDPPTCPVRYEDQVVFGMIVAIAAYLVYMALGVVYFLAAGLLIGNAWESCRRLIWTGLASRSRPVRQRPA